MSLSTTEITGSFIDPTTGQPLSNVGVTFQVSQVLYVSGIPVVAPSAPVAAEVSGGQLLSASGSPLELLDQGNTVTLESGTGFWFWEVVVTGDITDGWSFFLPHSATAVDLWSTRNTGTSGTGVTSWDGRTGAVTPASGDYTPSEVGALAAAASSTSVPAAAITPKVVTLTDGSSVAINAAAGNVFDWPLGGASHTLAAPTGLADGEVFTVRVKYGGSFTPLFAAIYDFGTAGAPSWTATSGKSDHVAFAYVAAANSNAGGCRCLGGGLGYTS